LDRLLRAGFDIDCVPSTTIYTGRNENIDLVLQSNWTGWSKNTFPYNKISYVARSGKFSHPISPRTGCM